MAGQKVGFIQATVMVGGFILTVVGVALIVVPLYRAVLGGSTALEELRPGGKVPLELMFGGLGLCLIAWVWALFSCMALWKRVRG